MTHVYSSRLVGTDYSLEASFALNVTKVTNDVIFLDNTFKLFTEPTSNNINVSVDRLSGHFRNCIPVLLLFLRPPALHL